MMFVVLLNSYVLKVKNKYNVGSGEPRTVEKKIRIAKAILNSRSKIIIKNEIELKSGTHEKSFWLDTSKLNKLGFVKNFTLEETIKDITKSEKV